MADRPSCGEYGRIRDWTIHYKATQVEGIRQKMRERGDFQLGLFISIDFNCKVRHLLEGTQNMFMRGSILAGYLQLGTWGLSTMAA
ncbi:hypothetical protein CHS0354_028331 [Potamilus streckersoni]|uniref:Uncharacterized protein n=1 Tax=Potamilus streckersoni TaxID=2493646 RepID=A0AAE0RTU2_9BIVA|nr:hypothetical protein CHS0354_028331 [Potamilus streckersoni]